MVGSMRGHAASLAFTTPAGFAAKAARLAGSWKK
jgi:hypothetical protein